MKNDYSKWLKTIFDKHESMVAFSVDYLKDIPRPSNYQNRDSNELDKATEGKYFHQQSFQNMCSFKLQDYQISV